MRKVWNYHISQLFDIRIIILVSFPGKSIGLHCPSWLKIQYSLHFSLLYPSGKGSMHCQLFGQVHLFLSANNIKFASVGCSIVPSVSKFSDMPVVRTFCSIMWVRVR